MNVELIIGIVSVIGALISLFAGIASMRREEIKARIERDTLREQSEQHRMDVLASVQDDTVGLYRKLSEQYKTITEKDKELIRTVTFVIRHLIVLERSVVDLLGEMEIRWEEHSPESARITCPFYGEINDFMYVRVREISRTLQETMDEVDKLLFNGSGPFLRDRTHKNKIVEEQTVTHKE